MKRLSTFLVLIFSLSTTYCLNIPMPDFLKEGIENIKTSLDSIRETYEKQKIIINADNPHKAEVAQTRVYMDLPSHELGPIRKRFDKAKGTLERFLNRPLERREVPKIGVVYSGGGYRAMILSLGYSLGLEKMGLFDAAQYMSMLSGSTWFGSKYMFAGSLEKVKSSDLAAIRAKQFDLFTMQKHIASHPSFLVNNVVWPKFLFGQSLSSIDIYGSLLSDVLYAPLGFPKKPKFLSEQKAAIVDGAKPYPIYTAIRVRQKHDYDWAEFTPDHFRLVEHDVYIPIWSFGRKFKNGQSTNFAPEQTMGYLAGIFGSAFAVNLRDIKRLMFESVVEEAEKQSTLEKIKYQVTARLIKLIADEEVGKLRAVPAHLPNPFYKMAGSLGGHKKMAFVDAGIDFNIPLPPLMQKNRNLDVLIVGDSSGNADTREELFKFFAYAKKNYGLNYQRTDDKSFENLGVYKAGGNAPVIVYINFMNDKKLMQKFANDPKLAPLIKTNNLQAFDAKTCKYCDTFNFDYSVENYNQLSGIAEFNMRAHEEALRKIIEEVIAEKQKKR